MTDIVTRLRQDAYGLELDPHAGGDDEILREAADHIDALTHLFHELLADYVEVADSRGLTHDEERSAWWLDLTQMDATPGVHPDYRWTLARRSVRETLLESSLPDAGVSRA